jgi:hypothetical protein
MMGVIKWLDDTHNRLQSKQHLEGKQNLGGRPGANPWRHT